MLGLIACYVLGALYPDEMSGAKKQDDSVPPGGNYTYTWTVKPEFAPAQGDSNCLTWAYHSHVIAYKDISSGLIGALLTCKKGTQLSSTKQWSYCTLHSFMLSIHLQHVPIPVTGGCTSMCWEILFVLLIRCSNIIIT